MNHAFLFHNSITFEERALRVFSFQYTRNPVFRRFCDALDVNPGNVSSPEAIPLLPVEAFRDAECTCWPGEEHDLVFRSSGTTGMKRSRHPVKNMELYAESVTRGMSAFYNLDDYVILACTPGYNNNPDSSLVWMLNYLVGLDESGLSRFLPVGQFQGREQGREREQGQGQERSRNKGSIREHSLENSNDLEPIQIASSGAGVNLAINTGGNFTHGEEKPESAKAPVPGAALDNEELVRITASGKKLMLFGAAFGLIDMAETRPLKLPPDSLIIETGGMKTHRREMGREQLHRQLSELFRVPIDNIHSEYGMTELLSQAWMQADGVFRCPHWMRVSVHDAENPLERVEHGREGLIGVTDLANLHSCSFLMTGDAGILLKDGAFEVSGRMKHYDLRGCNFLLEED